MRTNTNKLISGALVASIVLISQVSAATQIGSGIVQGSGALNTNIMWNDAFPGTASGTINGIVIKARIQPTLNMVVSGSGTIDLGTLSSAAYSVGSVSIEIGTNAADGAAVTAKSTNGGLKSTTGTGVFNSLDGLADSYKFASVLGTADSSMVGFNQGGAFSGEINNTTAQTIYTSNKPQPINGTNDLTFTVSAKPDEQSPAGDYVDTVVLTVTGTF